MVDGGPRLEWLEAIGGRHSLSFHGVGMSLAGPDPLDEDHLNHLKSLVERYRPALVSEHLAWSVQGGVYFADLLPVLRTRRGLDDICGKILRMQDTLGRTVLIENPTHYLDIDGQAVSEPDFLSELVARTGCGLLVDINNLYLSERNIGIDPIDWIDSVPLDAIGEFHLAGHIEDPEEGPALLIDSHDQAVPDPVWRLYTDILSRTGPRPTLIERDGNLPDFGTLLAERDRAEAILNFTSGAGRVLERAGHG